MFLNYFLFLFSLFLIIEDSASAVTNTAPSTECTSCSTTDVTNELITKIRDIFRKNDLLFIQRKIQDLRHNYREKFNEYAVMKEFTLSLLEYLDRNPNYYDEMISE